MGKLTPPGMTAQGLINGRTLCVATRLADSVTFPEFVLNVKRKAIAARAVQVDGELTVPAGSAATGQVRTGAYAATRTSAAVGGIRRRLPGGRDDESSPLDNGDGQRLFSPPMIVIIVAR